MESKPIKDFSANDRVEGYFGVRKKEIRDYSRGQYVSLDLGDYSGHIEGRIWEPDQFALEDLQEGAVVKVRGIVNEFRNKLQVNIARIRLATEDEYQLEDIMPHSSYTLDERRARILSLREKVVNTYIGSLLDSFLDDPAFMDQFLVAPAGKMWHHAMIGGLAEHTANVTELALKVSDLYDYIDKDLLIFGGILHDVGKVATYVPDLTFDYTNEGRLVGHICLVDSWVCERVKQIDTFPSSLLIKLRHMLLSHQGELENASPVKPMIPEAFLLYYCDEIDAKMGAITRIREKHDGVGWSEWVRLLDRFLYFGEGEPDEE